jgi:hypothetical protein
MTGVRVRKSPGVQARGRTLNGKALDEQRLLAYKKEGKPWKWIFRKFLGRTQPAIHTQWNIIQPKDK